MDFELLRKLFEDAYGAFVNTDGFTVGAAAELHAAFNIVSSALLQQIPFPADEYCPPIVGNCETTECEAFCVVEPRLCSSTRSAWDYQ